MNAGLSVHQSIKRIWYFNIVIHATSHYYRKSQATWNIFAWSLLCNFPRNRVFSSQIKYNTAVAANAPGWGISIVNEPSLIHVLIPSVSSILSVKRWCCPHRYRAVITISNYENLSGTFSQTSQIHFFSLEYFSIYVENTRNLIELVGEKKNFVCTIFLCRMHWLTNDGVHPTAVAAAMQTLRIGNRTSHFSPSFLRPTRACKIEYQRCEKKKSILMLPAVVASSSSGDMQTIAGRWYVRLHQRTIKRLLHENA